MTWVTHPFYNPEIHANNGYKIEELQISSALLSRLKNLEELTLDGPGDLHVNCASIEKLLGANCPTLKELQLTHTDTPEQLQFRSKGRPPNHPAASSSLRFSPSLNAAVLGALTIPAGSTYAPQAETRAVPERYLEATHLQYAPSPLAPIHLHQPMHRLPQLERALRKRQHRDRHAVLREVTRREASAQQIVSSESEDEDTDLKKLMKNTKATDKKPEQREVSATDTLHICA
ncbi:hypothetical protein B0H13DRAFT_2383895 [Mycena leptocephala]|nr:hypothetical protein B0H13DRAFT_2383895 [Mycena leptocephala]